jgi:sec-independent protein translocase protein TatA
MALNEGPPGPRSDRSKQDEMLNIGPQELLIILVIALLVVGPQRLPALGRSIGRGLRELRKAQDEVKRTINVNLDDEPPNGGASRRSAHRPPTPPADRPNAQPPVAPDATPTASEPLPASEVREISRSLGRSLAELRRAKEEVQRSFRVDLGRPTPAPRPPADEAMSPHTRPAAPAEPGPGGDETPAGDDPHAP